MIDLGGAKLVNTADPVNGTDVPSKSYLDNSVGRIKDYTDTKLLEQNARIDAIVNQINSQRNIEENVSNEETILKREIVLNEEEIYKKLDEQNRRIDAILSSVSYTNSLNVENRIREQNANIDALKNYINNHTSSHNYSDSDILNQLTNEIARAQSSEIALSAKCDILQQKVDHLFTFFFGTDTSVPLFR
jgi:hypothetical protein